MFFRIKRLLSFIFRVFFFSDKKEITLALQINFNTNREHHRNQKVQELSTLKLKRHTHANSFNCYFLTPLSTPICSHTRSLKSLKHSSTYTTLLCLVNVKLLVGFLLGFIMCNIIFSRCSISLLRHFDDCKKNGTN